MNKVMITGRFIKDNDMRMAGETAVVKNTIAVDRKFKKDGEPTADFLNVVAFGKVAEFIEKYTQKGSKVFIDGHIQTGNYTNKDGVKIYTTDIVVESVEFAESKGSENKSTGKDTSFNNVPSGTPEVLPFS